MRPLVRQQLRRFFRAVSLILCIGSMPAFPQAPGDIPVTMQGKENLRSLAKEYLGEPDDWETILYYNGLKSPEDLKAGQRIWIPVRRYKDLAKSIDVCQTTVINANSEGAGILAPVKIEQAIENLNRAVQQKKKGDLTSAEKAIALALDEAREALAETKEKRIQSVTAVLAEKRGTVQYRPNDENQWKDTVLKQELIQNDRLRTLSRSYGNVLFIDGSRVQMDENALIVIQAIDKDVLKNVNSVDILVLDGDVSTLIQALHGNDNFRVKSPGVSTNIRSRNFLTSRDQEKTTRFSNFEGEMDILSSGKQVTLSSNEGTKVKYGQVPEHPKKLLPPPLCIAPSEGQSVFDQKIAFSWTPVEQAGLYQLQISRNRAFTEIEKSMKINPAQTAVWETAQNGGYYWRISAIDNEQLQGPYSKPIGFAVQVDRNPPYLALTSPLRDTVIFNETIEIRGNTEKGVAVTVNGDSAFVSPEGNFQYTVKLNEGIQRITIAASDRAGNTSRMAREIVCNSGNELFMLSGGETLFLNSGSVTIRGRIKPKVRLEIAGQPVETRGDSFAHDLLLEEGTHEIRMKAASPEGKIQEKDLKITIDTKPPEIRIKEIPSYTEQSSILLEGSLSEPAGLSIDERPVPVNENRFSATIELKEGSNPVVVRAKDRAGNLTESSCTVCQDATPPQVLSYKLSGNRVTGGEKIDITLKAIDRGVGMARTGTFIVELAPGQAQLSGLLKLDQAKDTYEGTLIIPPGSQGTIKLKKVYISDYLGNTAVWP